MGMVLDWLRRSMPRSLYARAALILLVPILTLQLVISVGFIQRHFEGVTRQMTRSVLLELHVLLDRIAMAEGPEGARAAAESLAGPLEFSVALPATPRPEADVRMPWDLAGRTVIEGLRAGLPGLERVALPDDRTVRLWIATEHGPLELGFDRQRVSASNPHQLLVLMIVLGALLSVIAYLFLRNQLRPIKRLARAAEDYGRGRVAPYRPSGATEVRLAGAAFLDMRNRIERQSQTRTMMLSGVSHDLRTPLTRLRLELSLLEEEQAAPMLGDLEEMERMLDAFLDYARTEAEDAPELCDLTGLVQSSAARQGEVRFLGVSGPDPGEVRVRPLGVRRAVDNLIGNALRYGSRAEVSLGYGDRSVRITVEDDGPGIPPERRDEAVRPFTRLDPSRNQDRGMGVGLGLAIVSDIARAHGGALRLGQSERLGGLRADLVLAL